MKKLKDLFVSSFMEFRNLKSLTLASMFGAVSIVLGFYTLMVGDFLKIGFTFLPNEFVYYLFGPAFGAIFGAMMDILTFIVKPTGAFFFGFTFSAILNGLLFGVLLYQKPISLKRVIIADTIQLIFINILLNTYWLSILLGKGFFVLLPARALKELIMYPVNIILLYTVIKGVEATKILRIFQGKKAKA